MTLSRRSLVLTAAAAPALIGKTASYTQDELEKKIARRDFRGLTKQDLPTPVLVVDQEIFDKNIQHMAQHCKASGKNLRAHVKVPTRSNSSCGAVLKTPDKPAPHKCLLCRHPPRRHHPAPAPAPQENFETAPSRLDNCAACAATDCARCADGQRIVGLALPRSVFHHGQNNTNLR